MQPHNSLPSDPRARLTAVGERMFGHWWRERMSGALGISRETLRRWGVNPPADLDARLIAAVDHELARGAELRDLRAKLKACAA